MMMIEENRVSRFWAENCTLKARLLSKSSWSLVARAMILPVGVTSNQLKGVCSKVVMYFFWMTLDEDTMKLAKK